jgi:hypothetical protein
MRERSPKCLPQLCIIGIDVVHISASEKRCVSVVKLIVGQISGLDIQLAGHDS